MIGEPLGMKNPRYLGVHIARATPGGGRSHDWASQWAAMAFAFMVAAAVVVVVLALTTAPAHAAIGSR